MAKKKNKRRPNYQAPQKATAAKQDRASGVTAPKGAPTRPKTQRPTGRRAAKSARSATLSWWILGIGVAVLVTAVAVLPAVLASHDAGVTDATNFDIPALEGDVPIAADTRVKLTDYAGKPLVLNFFASWCTSCEAELPRFRTLAVDHEDELEVVFVNTNETGDWKPMARRTGIMDQPLAKDINGSNGNGLYRSLGGSGGMPMTAYFDELGILVHVDRGELTSEVLRSRMRDLFGLLV